MAINKQLEEKLKKYISDELSAEEKERIQKEAETNLEISEYLNLHSNLTNPEMTFEMADENEFQKMRSVSINKIHHYNNHKSRYIFSSLWDNILQPFRIPAFSAAFAGAMFLIGFFMSTSVSDNSLIRNINYAAEQTGELQESINSPYIYSNTIFRENEDGLVSVSFDVTRHLQVTRKKNDPLIQDILAQSLVNASSTGEQLRNISVSEKVMHPKIKQALIKTMLNDGNEIVRQKSLFSLMKYPNDEVIQTALIRLLTEEKSVYMRLTAIDYLSNNNVNPALLEKGLEEYKNVNSAVTQKIKQLKYEH
ncbi:MAG: HEAT repeat domain-containing protein [Calditrichaeota bacterium]|nr:HEAT repeat domain-containing protein [Calditrichota bacterium]